MARLHDGLRRPAVATAAVAATPVPDVTITPGVGAGVTDAGVASTFFFIGVVDPTEVEASRQPGGNPLPIDPSPFFAPVAEPSHKTGPQAMSVAVPNHFNAPDQESMS